MTDQPNPRQADRLGPSLWPVEALLPLRLAWLPAAAFLLVIVGLWAADLRISHESPYLLIGLNFVFSVLASLAVAFLMGRSFLASPKPGLLLVGCGALAWGLAGFVGSIAALSTPSGFSANTLVTIHNVCIWISALCHLTGAAFALRWGVLISSPRLWLGLAYATLLGLVGFVTLAALSDWIPVFFVEAQGGTPLRQSVLGSAIAMLALTVLMLRAMNQARWSAFAYGYALGLALVAVGLLGVMLQQRSGDLLNWTGRAAQFLGGVYILLAAIASVREPSVRLGHAVGESRHRFSVAIALVVAAAIVRLVFLQALGLKVAFVTFYPAVIVAALYGGLWAGLLAAVLSALLADYFWIEPVERFAIIHPGDWLSIAVFLLSCTMISTITEAMHRAQSRALRAEAKLPTGLDGSGSAEPILQWRTQRLALEQLNAIFPVNAAFPAALAMLGLLAWFAYQNTTAMLKSSRWETHTYQVVNAINALRSDLTEVGFSANAYILTGDEKDLEAQTKATSQVTWHLAELQRLTQGNLRQPSSLQGLTVPLHAILAELEQVARMRRTQGFAAAQQRVAESGWRERMAAINAQVDESQHLELRLLQARSLTMQAETSAANRTGGLGILLSMAVLSLVFFALRRKIAERVLAEQELERHRNHLEELVGKRTAELEQETAGHLAAERALRYSEERLRLVLQASALGTFEIDLASGQGIWNPLEYELLGLEPGQASANPETFFRFVHPEDLALLTAQWMEAVRTGHFDAEFRIVRADGEVRWLAGRGRFVGAEEAGESGAQAFLGVNFDITERKEADATRAQLAAIVESSQDAIIGKDLDGRVTSWNRAAEDLFGYTAEEMLGRPISVLFPPSLHPEEHDILRRIGQGNVVAHYETERLCKNGRLIFVSITVSPVKDAAGRVIGASKIARDITARRRMEEERDQFIALVKTSTDFIGMCDLQGAPFFVNEAGLRLLGLDGMEALSTISVRDYFFPEDQAFIIDEFLPSTLQGPAEVEIRFRHFKTGEAIWMIYSVFALRGKDGQPTGFATVSRNITERKHMEQALQASEQFKQGVLDSLPAHIAVLDNEGTLLAVNRPWLSFAAENGNPDAATIAVGANYLTVCRNAMQSGEPVAQAVLQGLEAVLSGRMPRFELEYPCDLPTEKRWYVVHILKPSSQVGGAIVTHLDITQRKQAEAALSQERLLLREVIDAVPSLIFVKDREGRILLCNEAFARDYSAVSAADLVGKTNAEINPHTDEVAQFYRDDREVVETGRAKVQWGEKATAADGTVHWFNTVKLPMRNALGDCDRVLGVATDITDRKLAEQALYQSQADLNRAQAVAHTGSWRMDIRRNRLSWSDENYRIFGIPKGSALNYETFLEMVHPEDRDLVDSAWRAGLAGEPYDIEHRIIVGEAVRWLRELAELEYDEDGTLLGGFGTTQDISELKITQQALQEADRRKDEFLAMLAHELRNPLTPIMVAAQMLQRRGASDPSLVTWAANTVKHQAEHLTQLVNQLLDVSRVTQGKITLNKAPWDLRELLGKAAESCQPFIEQHQHELIVSLSPELMLAHVDAVRIEQVLGNLLNNAVKYTANGGKIWLSLERQGDMAVIRVRDNGIGISATMLPKVFDLFVQAERTLDRSQGGMGIGLALVKSLVEKHGGRVSASSEGIDAGSQFELWLPLLAQRPELVEVASPPFGQTPVKAHRILVVDDNDDVRFSMVLLLRSMGHEVFEAENGQQALDLARRVPLDVVLLDIGMPGQNGYEVARLFRQDPALSSLLLIAITGYSQGDQLESIRAGFNHHMVKPVNIEELAQWLADRV